MSKRITCGTCICSAVGDTDAQFIAAGWYQDIKGQWTCPTHKWQVIRANIVVEPMTEADHERAQKLQERLYGTKKST